ncbi:hypothetical protein EDD66_104184 [Mobilisporobacter senegalensis]|uniref:Uncharacterized protein n=1 Tax=Mobilisporobacter senegalensis TaxID=1329262 RepID=A0A3N1XUM0_9FIRM|nr:hypothetical protein EDD66_104184 [Mobilisporobacter senegalensis]
MDILVAFTTTLLTIAILSNLKLAKTSIQLMLVGIEMTIIGAVYISISALPHRLN